MDEPQLKVLLIAGRFEVRGSSAYTLRLAENLSLQGVAARILCTDARLVGSERRARLDLHEYPYLTLPLLGRLTRTLVHRRTLDWPPDLVHVQSPDMISVGSWLARRFDCPYLVSVHEVLPPGRSLRLDPLRTKWVIAVSEPVKTAILKRHKLAADRVRVIHAGVESETGRCLPAVLDPGHLSVIGVAGPLQSVKGLPFFLGAAQKVLSVRPKIEFLVSGAGPEEDLDISDHVTFVPNLTDFSEPLAAMDIFCLPSLQQGLGTIMLEAMALGKPVIASGVGGVFSVVRDNETGLVVPPSDSARLAERMLELLNDPVRARAIGEAGRRLVREEFGTEKMVRETAALYRRVLTDEPVTPEIAVPTH